MTILYEQNFLADTVWRFCANHKNAAPREQGRVRKKPEKFKFHSLWLSGTSLAQGGRQLEQVTSKPGLAGCSLKFYSRLLKKLNDQIKGYRVAGEKNEK
jgi:hypothetical protein